MTNGTKVIQIEVKSSGVGKHESILTFRDKFSNMVADSYILSQKDLELKEKLVNLPIYMTHLLAAYK